MSVPSLEAVKNEWDEFSEVYLTSWTLTTSQSAYVLAAHTELHTAKNILEVGTGGGFGTEIALLLKAKDARVVSVDISKEFLRIAGQRLGEHPQLELQEADAENLPFKDGAFDRYIANFVLHLTPDPVAMLKEAKRVLQPGGIAAFSVWGRKEYSPHFTLGPTIAKEVGVDLNGGQPPGRSSFHLGEDLETVREMALDAGFSKALTWYAISPVNAVTAESWVDRHMKNPYCRKAMKDAGEEKARQYRQRLLEEAEKIIQEGRPISSETLFLVVVA